MSQAGRLPLEIARVEQTAVVSFTCDALRNEEIIREIDKELVSLLHSGCRQFILNFGKVRAMSSLMLAKLVSFQKKVTDTGAELTLCSVGPDLYGLFEWTQLDKLFTIEQDGG